MIAGWPQATHPCRAPFIVVVLWYGFFWALVQRAERARNRTASDATWIEDVRDQHQTQNMQQTGLSS
jgi:hypothetical protein